jgi:hypothetical protein
MACGDRALQRFGGERDEGSRRGMQCGGDIERSRRCFGICRWVVQHGGPITIGLLCPCESLHDRRGEIGDLTGAVTAQPMSEVE